jgi:putative radical SAM enzyme (TIGR03279 family)
MIKTGIKILKVRKRSAADRIGLLPGDTLLSINGNAVEDELGLRFHLSGGHTEFRVSRSGRIENFAGAIPEATDAGITAEEFRTKTCNNACLFCFVDQLPAGVRPSLRVKDDDYRLSFLHGNYITLTNLSDRELQRIIDQRLSPLYVSVHATDPELRTRILGRKKADDLIHKLEMLTRGGIHIHAQVVLLPGINDRAHLKKTVFDLFGLYPGVQSVAIVPLGLSDFGKPRERLVPVTPDFSREVIRAVRPWQNQFRGKIHRTFACLADEFYIQGNLPIPDRDHYDDFAQIEDGVGMTRSFLAEFENEFKRRSEPRPGLKGTLVTGRLFAPILKRCIARFNAKFGSALEVCAAENRFLGKDVTVAGLLSGQDILAGLQGKDPGQFVVIPEESVSRTEGILLDNLSPEEMAARIGRPVYPSGRTTADFFSLLRFMGKRSPRKTRNSL